MAIIVIPARLASTRLPNKLLLNDTGKPLIYHTIDHALESKFADYVYVASEDSEILSVVSKRYSSKVITAQTPKCSSGTERVRWLVDNRLDYDADVVVNLQADEPELDGKHLDKLISELQSNSISDVATLSAPASNLDYKSYSVVKVVVDHNGHAMYFSRCAIPHGGKEALKHIGVYAYKQEFLVALNSMEPTTLGCESLEQLQWLQSGFRIVVLETDIRVVGVDTIEEYKSFVKRWKKANP